MRAGAAAPFSTDGMSDGGGLPVLGRNGSADCEERGPACPYQPLLSGTMVAGIVLATAGLVGIVINATRPEVKTSR